MPDQTSLVENNDKNFGVQLREYRRQLRYTQEQVASLIREQQKVKLHNTALSRIEMGGPVSRDHLLALLRFYTEQGAIPSRVELEKTTMMAGQKLSDAEIDSICPDWVGPAPRSLAREVVVLCIRFKFSNYGKSTPTEKTYRELLKLVEMEGGQACFPGLLFAEHRLSIVFGMDSAWDSNLPLTAVRAGLNLYEHFNHEFDVTVGLDAGAVERLSDGENIQGRPLIIAPRITATSLKSGVWISRQVMDYVEGRAIKNRDSLKNIESFKYDEEDITIYEVRNLFLERPANQTPITRAIRGITPEMVGREVNLRVLLDTFYTIQRTRVPQVATIFGPAGIGKSRLHYEFDRALPRGTNVLYGHPRVNKSPDFSLIQQLFGDLESIEAYLKKALPRNDALEAYRYIEYLLDPKENSPLWLAIRENKRAVAIAHFVEFIRHFLFADASENVAVICIEDCHLADSKSLDLLNECAKNLSDFPFFLVCFGRNEGRWAPWLEEAHIWDMSTHYFPMKMTPLFRTDCVRLVENIFQQASLDINIDNMDVLILEIANRAEGIPYFVEETIRLLIEKSLIIIKKGKSVGKDTWLIPNLKAAISEVRDTHSMRNTDKAINEARIENLGALEKAFLCQVAVVGRFFWGATINALFTDKGWTQDVISRTMERLQESEMIFERATSCFPGTPEYVFKQRLLRDTAYQKLPKKEKAELHAKVATWYEDFLGTNASQYADEIEHHRQLANANS